MKIQFHRTMRIRMRLSLVALALTVLVGVSFAQDASPKMKMTTDIPRKSLRPTK